MNCIKVISFLVAAILLIQMVQAGGRGAKELVHEDYESEEGGFGGEEEGEFGHGHGHGHGHGRRHHGHEGEKKPLGGSHLDASALADILQEPSQAQREVLGSVLGGKSSDILQKGGEKKDELAKVVFDPFKAGPLEIVKLFLNPFELIKVFSEAFKLPLEGLIKKIEKGFIVTAETVFNPPLIGLRLVEKMFVPDYCRLKFMCKIGASFRFAKNHLGNWSPTFLGTSNVVKAFTTGILQEDCEVSFKTCDLKLEKSFEDLKLGQHGEVHSHKGGLGHEYSRSLGEVKSLASASIEKVDEQAAKAANQSSSPSAASSGKTGPATA